MHVAFEYDMVRNGCRLMQSNLTRMEEASR